MAKKKRGDGHGGGHGWFVTFADLMGLMMSFFVMLTAFSTMDNNKLKIVAGSMRDAFGVQTEARYSGIIESDGLPTREKLKNTDHIPPEEASNRPTPDEQERSVAQGARLKIDREFALASASLRQALQMADLRPTRFVKGTDDELLAVIVQLWERTLAREGRTPQRRDLKTYQMPVSGDTIIRRFGTWLKALSLAQASVTQDSLPGEPIALLKSPAHQTRKPMSLRKRCFVMKRDGFACVRCGATGRGVRLEVHHRTPFAQGGSDALDNLETLCFDCNRGQRDDVV